jgi:hypothetical protein
MWTLPYLLLPSIISGCQNEHFAREKEETGVDGRGGTYKGALSFFRVRESNSREIRVSGNLRSHRDVRGESEHFERPCDPL